MNIFKNVTMKSVLRISMFFVFIFTLALNVSISNTKQEEKNAGYLNVFGYSITLFQPVQAEEWAWYYRNWEANGYGCSDKYGGDDSEYYRTKCAEPGTECSSYLAEDCYRY